MPLLPLTGLVQVVRRLKRQGKVVAFTNGCFDILHVGHLDTLERAKRLGDCLIVGINSDASVRRLKGPHRPVVPARERAKMVAALKPVDYVVFFSEDTPLKLIQAICPHVLAKGGDWIPEKIVGRELVESAGGRVVALPYLKGRSTSTLLSEIRKSL